jgi:polysaccharide pyruvyl transferase WcaK-like protein
MRRIGLLDHMTGANLGDAATQDAVIHNIQKRQPDSEICLFSHDPDRTLERHGISGFPLEPSVGGSHVTVEETELRQEQSSTAARRRAMESTRALLKRVPGARGLYHGLERLRREVPFAGRSLSILRDFDLLVVSGGGQLDDTWGGCWQAPFNLLRWSALARLRGTRLVYLSVGAGPLREALSRKFAVRALRLAGFRSFRDQESADLVERLGVPGPNPVFPDLAHSYPIDLETSADWPVDHPLDVGIGPFPYMNPRLYPEKDASQYASYLAAMASFAEWLVDHGHRARFLCGDVDQDTEVMSDIRTVLVDRDRARVAEQLLQTPIATVENLLDEIAKTDVVLSSRFHGVLFAQLLNKPVIAASYHQKIDSLMADVGQAEQSMPIGALEVDPMIRCLQEISLEGEAIKQRIHARVTERRQSLEALYDGIFGEVSVGTAADATHRTGSKSTPD